MEGRSAQFLLPAWFWLLAIALVSLCKATSDNDTPSYGVDVSFPTHNHFIRANSLGDKQALYDTFLQGCYNDKSKGRDMCDSAERTRMGRNSDVPRSMVNFTTTGFVKMNCPQDMYAALKEFWDAHRDHKMRVERRDRYPAIITNMNIWEAPTSLVDPELHDKERHLKLKEMAQSSIGPMVKEWLGKDVIATRFYGIRVYQEGALFAPHMDLVPLIVGVIINVHQSGLQEDWPFEVISHNGQAHNVTLKPGEMVLFESHSVIHGRPFPLRGDLYANYNIHFELADHGFPDSTVEQVCGVDGGCSDSTDRSSTVDDHMRLPSYILEHSPEADRLNLVQAARDGDEMVFQLYVGAGKAQYLHEQDANGWQPIHEAARAGHLNVVQYLLENGGDKQYETTNLGETALSLVEHHLTIAEHHLARAKWKFDRLTETRDYLKAQEER